MTVTPALLFPGHEPNPKDAATGAPLIEPAKQALVASPVHAGKEGKTQKIELNTPPWIRAYTYGQASGVSSPPPPPLVWSEGGGGGARNARGAVLLLRSSQETIRDTEA